MRSLGFPVFGVAALMYLTTSTAQAQDGKPIQAPVFNIHGATLISPGGGALRFTEESG
ncbi:MAG: hypothetical protein ABI120_16365 [Gemmatimonadaceae bacterium]